MEINELIKKRRLELGLTLKDVAYALGTAESTISRYESSNIQNMGIDKIIALSKVLQCSPTYLLGWSESCNYDNVLSQELKRGLELLEETEVVLEVVAEVTYLPLEHRDTLHAHSECESAVFPAVDSRCFKDIRIHHSAAHDLEPSCSLADVAALSATDVATYVHLCRRFSEREV